MLTKSVEIKASPKEVAELLFELDNKEVAEVFAEWSKLFEAEYERRKAAKETIWIFGLNHFMMHVIDEMDDDGKNLIRSMYSSMVYKLVGDVHKKHLLQLHLQ